jgi:hypothetical protein
LRRLKAELLAIFFTTQQHNAHSGAVLPLLGAREYTSSKNGVISLVRDLKRFGSDFLMEEDLAAIFG